MFPSQNPKVLLSWFFPKHLNRSWFCPLSEEALRTSTVKNPPFTLFSTQFLGELIDFTSSTSSVGYH